MFPQLSKFGRYTDVGPLFPRITPVWYRSVIRTGLQVFAETPTLVLSIAKLLETISEDVAPRKTLPTVLTSGKNRVRKLRLETKVVLDTLPIRLSRRPSYMSELV